MDLCECEVREFQTSHGYTARSCLQKAKCQWLGAKGWNTADYRKHFLVSVQQTAWNVLQGNTSGRGYKKTTRVWLWINHPRGQTAAHWYSLVHVGKIWPFYTDSTHSGPARNSLLRCHTFQLLRGAMNPTLKAKQPFYFFNVYALLGGILIYLSIL